MNCVPLINRCVVLAFGVALFCNALRAEPANLLANGDFEQPSKASLPAGWTMWGAAKFKVPSDFTLDGARPHGGKACFRIHHPANTGGYVVSSPDSAIRPKTGMMYTVTFWARSDRAGEAMFGWEGYRSIKPFVDAPSPGLFPIAVNTEWKQYCFSVHEGWDLFADQCRHLMVLFKATGRTERECTLWIDDVVVTEEPSPRKDHLVNPETLVHPPLELRLKEGKEVTFIIDAGKRQAEAMRAVGGVSFHRIAGWTKLPYDKTGQYVLSKEHEDAIRELRLPMTRFYALGDEPFGLEAAIDKAAEFCERIGIPTGAVPLEFEIQGATSKLAPEVWARGVQHSLSKGYGFDRWEITNEPYVGHPGRIFNSADEFLKHFLAVSKAVRQAHPQCRVGLPIHHKSPAWGNYVLKKAAGHYDFVAAHYYSFVNVQRESFEDIVLSANFQILDEILRTNALMRHYNPGRDVYQYDTEWGMHSSGPNGERADHVVRNGNIYGMMHRAVRLIHYLREGLLRGASSWEMFTYSRSPGFGFLVQDKPRLRSMNYWLYYHFNRHAGRWVLPIEGLAPFHEGKLAGKTVRGPLTPAIATLNEDGKRLYLIVANGSWKQNLRCRIELKDFAAKNVAASVLTTDNPDGSPFVERREELVHDLPVTLDGGLIQLSLPAHSVLFLTLHRD